MRNLHQITSKCMDELEAIGIELGRVENVIVNTRAVNRWGQCKRLASGGYEINISSRLLDENVPEISLKNTVIHELLHTCRNCMNHGAEWKYLAQKVNRAYPQYNIKRTASSEEYHVQTASVVRKPKYAYECIKCKKQIFRYRESEFTRNVGNYRCASCHGKFQRIYA